MFAEGDTMMSEVLRIPSEGSRSSSSSSALLTDQEEPFRGASSAVYVASFLSHFWGMSAHQGVTQQSAFPPAAMKSAKEMENIQSRRARLEALTATIRLPPLTPGGSRRQSATSTRPSSRLTTGASRLYGGIPVDHYRRRIGDFSSTSTGSSRGQSASLSIPPGTPKLPTLELPPMTSSFRPYHNPLPSIGKLSVNEEDEHSLHPEANLDSPPPPTYESTVQVSKWVEQITQDNNNNNSNELPEEPPLYGIGDLPLQEEEENEADEQEEEKEEEEEEEEPLGAIKKGSERPDSAKSQKLNGDDENKDQSPIDYEAIVSQMGDEDLTVRLEATKKARMSLSTDTSPNITSLMDAGVLTPAIHSLQRDSPELQYEALWVLTNIASGRSEDTLSVVEAGALPKMIKLLKSPDVRVREQAVWALGNVAGDSGNLRNMLIDEGVLEPLLEMLDFEMPVSLMGNYAWLLSNLTRHKPFSLDAETLGLILKGLKAVVYNTDASILSDCCWAFSYITEGPNEYIQAVIDGGFSPRMVELMKNDSTNVRKSALRVCGNIATGTDEQTDRILSDGALDILKPMLNNDTDAIRKEVTWFLSNITAGTQAQIQKVIDSGILPDLVETLKKGPLVVSKEAAWAFSNLTLSGSRDQIKAVVDAGGVEALLKMCKDTVDGQGLHVSLEGLQNILKASTSESDDNPDFPNVKDIILENNGVEILEVLLGYNDGEVVKLANTILNEYFHDDESVDEGVIMALSDEVSLEEKEDSSEEKDSASVNVPEQALKYMQKDSAIESPTSGSGVSEDGEAETHSIIEDGKAETQSIIEDVKAEIHSIDDKCL